MAKLGCFVVALVCAVLLWQVPFFGPLLAAAAFSSAMTLGMLIAAWIDRGAEEKVSLREHDAALIKTLAVRRRSQQHTTVNILQIDARSVNQYVNQELTPIQGRRKL